MFVLINTFHVECSTQGRVIDLLVKVTETQVSQARGFVSSTLHRSLDGTKVVMRAEWESQAAYEDMRRQSSSTQALDELMSLARFELGMYEVVGEFASSQGKTS